MGEITTTIECTCGKKFVNKGVYGVALGLVNHSFNQMFYNLKAAIHFIICRHKLKCKYEIFD